MSEYRILETPGFRRDVASLGAVAAKRIQSTPTQRVYPVLRSTPREVPGAARLQDWDRPTWRFRIGDWRIFFEIDDDSRVVTLTVANHRKDAYR